jgi:hypothetical protein
VQELQGEIGCHPQPDLSDIASPLESSAFGQ